MSTLGFIDINKAPFKVFIFSMSTLKGAFQFDYRIYFLSLNGIVHTLTFF